MENTFIQMLYPIHPKLVHFPIALVISAMGMQGLGCLFRKDFLRNGALLMLILGVLSMSVVMWSGLLEAERLHLNHPVLTAHKQFAFAAMWSSLVALPILWVLRSKNIKIFQIVFLIVLIIVSSLLGLAAHQGGRMVYEYGVGVSQ
ncbi:MAG: hypothetical protein H6754_08870 [Candidatus Omnitrophica bacterium]|nr:hypothetical protein [Candidatus Omnitrophota bacterium]